MAFGTILKVVQKNPIYNFVMKQYFLFFHLELIFLSMIKNILFASVSLSCFIQFTIFYLHTAGPSVSLFIGRAIYYIVKAGFYLPGNQRGGARDACMHDVKKIGKVPWIPQTTFVYFLTKNDVRKGMFLRFNSCIKTPYTNLTKKNSL